MNEQIKLLYGNALDKAVPYTWHNLDHVEVEKIMKVFAELIVEKCAGIIESQDVDPSFKLRMSWAVKKHFGVK